MATIPPKKRSLPPRKPSFSTPRVGKSLPPKPAKRAPEIHFGDGSGFGENLHGMCIVCGGSLAEDYFGKDDGSMHSGRIDGLHCTRCGIRYDFRPPVGLKRI